MGQRPMHSLIGNGRKPPTHPFHVFLQVQDLELDYTCRFGSKVSQKPFSCFLHLSMLTPLPHSSIPQRSIPQLTYDFDPQF
jgi:hypothetical protein